MRSVREASSLSKRSPEVVAALLIILLLVLLFGGLGIFVAKVFLLGLLLALLVGIIAGVGRRGHTHV
jgi:hypothetical protein